MDFYLLSTLSLSQVSFNSNIKVRHYQNFLKLITILLKSQESCVINRDKRALYFPLEKDTQQ